MPKIGSAAKISRLDLLMIGLLSDGVTKNNLKDKLIQLTEYLSIKIKISEAPSTPNFVGNEIINNEVDNFLAKRYDNYKRLGAI
jgi:hypothetical protein